MSACFPANWPTSHIETGGVFQDSSQRQLHDHRDNVQYQALHHFKQEVVRLERWQHDSTITLDSTGGIEVLIINGELSNQGEIYAQFDWLGLPIGKALNVTTSTEDCTVWIKTGHHKYRL